MSDAIIYILGTLAIVWSLFLMYYISFKLKMHQFEEQLDTILRREVRESLGDLKYKVYSYMEDHSSKFIIEALPDVVRNNVKLRWVQKDANIDG